MNVARRPALKALVMDIVQNAIVRNGFERVLRNTDAEHVTVDTHLTRTDITVHTKGGETHTYRVKVTEV